MLQPVKHNYLTQWAPIFASMVFLVLTLFVGVFVVLEESTDTRRYADEVNRNVELVFVPSSTPLRKDTLSTIFIRLNTQGEKIDGVQVVFDVKTGVTDALTLNVKEPSGMRRAWEKVEGIPGGKRVSFALITTNPDQPFSNGSPADIAEVTFAAKQTGGIDLVFNDGWTKANKHKSYANVLKPYVAYHYDVDVAPSPAPTPKSTTTTSTNKGTTTTGTSTTSGKGGVTTTKTTTATVTITSSAAASPSPNPGADLAMCNKSCTYSSQCGSDFLCYRGECRRKGNVTSATCTRVDDAGSASCNAACTSSSDCKDGLTCYQNKCRDASNPESLSCTKEALDDEEVIAELCDTDCTTNAECGDLLSCYRGTCRLATNPTSTSCLATGGGTTDASPSPTASASSSPSPNAEGGQSSLLGTIFRWLLVLGAIIGLIIVGIMGYLWYQDQKTSGL